MQQKQIIERNGSNEMLYYNQDTIYLDTMVENRWCIVAFVDRTEKLRTLIPSSCCHSDPCTRFSMHQLLDTVRSSLVGHSEVNLRWQKEQGQRPKPKWRGQGWRQRRTSFWMFIRVVEFCDENKAMGIRDRRQSFCIVRWWLLHLNAPKPISSNREKLPSSPLKLRVLLTGSFHRARPCWTTRRERYALKKKTGKHADASWIRKIDVETHTGGTWKVNFWILVKIRRTEFLRFH